MLRYITIQVVLLALNTTAQTTWEWIQPEGDRHSRASDVLFTEDRILVTTISSLVTMGSPDYRSTVHALNPDGGVTWSLPILPDHGSVTVSCIRSRQPGHPIFVSGGCGTGDDNGVYAYMISEDGALLNSLVRLYPGSTRSTAEAALATADGGLLLGGTLSIGSTTMNRIVLLKVAPNGTLDQEVMHGQDQGSKICQQVVEWDGVPWITVNGRLPLSDEVSSSCAFRLNEELGIDGWFQYARLDIDPEPPIDSIPEGVMDLVPISPTRYVGSGNIADYTFPLVVVSDSTRELYHHFIPVSDLPMHFLPWQQSLSATPDGNLMYAVHENYLVGWYPPWTPIQPSRIQVYKLDTSLNVLCEYVLDGFSTNTHYFVNRIKATADGGFMLIGARRNFDDPNGKLDAWVRKFAATDCSVGIAERPGGQTAVVFPNPGSAAFTLLLNGAARNGTVTLFDATGRQAGTAPLRGGQAQMDTQGLASGVYAYQVRSSDGHLTANGRWVKE